MSQSHDPFDDFLRTSLGRRPEAPPPPDLAARAMRIAQTRASTVETNQLLRFRIMMRVASLAALILICAFVYVGIHGLADHGNLSLTPGNTWTDSTTTASSSTTTTSDSSATDSSAWTWILMIGVVGFTGLGAVTMVRQSSPFNGAAGLLTA